MSRFWSVLLCVVVGTAGLGERAWAVEYALPIDTKLNTTGRVIIMQVPLNDDGRQVGDVTIRIAPDDSVAVEKSELLHLLAGATNDATRRQLEQLPSQQGFSRLEVIRAAGHDVKFDPATQEMSIHLSTDDRQTREIDLGSPRASVSNTAMRRPADVSGYINIVAGIDYAWDGMGTDQNDVGAHLELESALRMSNAVLENRVIYDGDVDTTFCPVGAYCDFGHVSGFKRQSTRLSYDLPAEQVRVSLGDNEAAGIGLQRRADIAGLSVEKSPRRFDPLASGATFSSRSLRIERESDVEIRVNGALLHRLHLRSGIYDLRDLPLTTGANNVEITVIDDLGQRTTQSAHTFYDDSLLAEGRSEWIVSAGIPSYFLDDERRYDYGGYAATAYLRYGLSDDLTGIAHAQADQNVVMAGFGAVIRTTWGVFSADAAVSSGRLGTGGAANLNWDVLNFDGLFAPQGESLRLRAELRSSGFHTPGEYLVDYSNIIYPEYNYWLRLEGSYSLPLPAELTASLSARYQFSDSDRQSYSRYVVDEDRYGADVTLSRSLTETSSASLTVGYSNESYLNDLRWDGDSDPEFRVAFRYFWRPDEKTSIVAGFDTLNRQAIVTGNRQNGDADGAWQANLELRQDPLDDRVAANGSVNYQGNRGIVGVTQLSGLSTGRKQQRGQEQRTLVRAGTAIAFADGHVAVGQPIRNGAFAIVHAHESIAANEIAVGGDGAVLAKTDRLGPALVTNIPSFTPSSIPIAVADLPVGYSLGSSTIDTLAPNKAGYAIEVGSDRSISAVGTLSTTSGTPAELRAGMLHPEGSDEPSIRIFTNGAGRFAAEGLSPGRWIIELEGEDAATRYVLTIPSDASGLARLGTLSPATTP